MEKAIVEARTLAVNRAVIAEGAASAPSNALRRKLGIYYTPAVASQFIASWTIRSPVETVLEPSFGGCALLRAAVARLEALGCAEPNARLQGFDVDPSAFGYLTQIVGSRRHDGFVKQDFLHTRPAHASVSAIIANPPFVGYRAMSSSQRTTVEKWRRDYPFSFSKGAGLWAYFLIHSLAYLQRGGRIAFVLPATFITADYSRAIKEHIEQRFSEVTVIEVREQLFLHEGAEERTVILLADGYLTDTCPCHTRHVTVGRLSDILNGEFLGNLDVTPPASNHASILRRLDEDSVTRVGEIARVTIGEVTGDSDFFVKTATEWSGLGVRPSDLVRIIRRSTDIPGIVVGPEDTERLPLMLRPRHGKMTASVKKYLDGYDETQILKNSTFQKRKPWFAVSYETEAVAFVPSLSHRSLRLVVNQAKVSCTNSMYKIHFLPNRGCPHIAALGVAWHTTIAQLSAEVQSRTLGAGALKLEPADLRQILLPIASLHMSAQKAKSLLKQIDQLVREGNSEAARKLADDATLAKASAPSRVVMEQMGEELIQFRSSRTKQSTA